MKGTLWCSTQVGSSLTLSVQTELKSLLWRNQSTRRHQRHSTLCVDINTMRHLLHSTFVHSIFAHSTQCHRTDRTNALAQFGLKARRHRDKPRVCTPAKNVSTFEINIFYYFLFMDPTLGFDTKQRNSFLMFFFTIKARFCQYYSSLNMRKITLFDQFLVLLGPIICMFK